MIYHRLITQPFSYDDIVLSGAPLSYWKLDDAQGSTTVIDSSGNGHSLIVDATSTDTDILGLPGLVNDGGTCAYFRSPSRSGSSDTILHSPSETGWMPVGNSERSIECWISTDSDSLGPDYPFFYFGVATSDGALVQLSEDDDAGSRYIVCRTGNTSHIKYGPVPLGIKHVVFIVPSGAVNASDTYCIVNGTKYSGSLSSGTDDVVNTLDADLILGNQKTVVHDYFGKLDNVAVYDYALSLSKCQAHYNLGS